ncbi:MAG TPA: hypothetical protein VHM48_09265 [Candidatus Limnocylindrales bacterium]|nr:hypothetical protein [Candidatus Limnocylindrales bacterium]
MRATYTRTASGGTSAPGHPSRRLRCDWLDDREPPIEFELPAEAGPLIFGQSELWLASGRSLVVLPLPVASGPARVWDAPAGQIIQWFDPDARIAIGVNRATRENVATMTGYDLA